MTRGLLKKLLLIVVFAFTSLFFIACSVGRGGDDSDWEGDDDFGTSDGAFDPMELVSSLNAVYVADGPDASDQMVMEAIYRRVAQIILTGLGLHYGQGFSHNHEFENMGGRIFENLASHVFDDYFIQWGHGVPLTFGTWDENSGLRMPNTLGTNFYFNTAQNNGPLIFGSGANNGGMIATAMPIPAARMSNDGTFNAILNDSWGYAPNWTYTSSPLPPPNQYHFNNFLEAFVGTSAMYNFDPTTATDEEKEEFADPTTNLNRLVNRIAFLNQAEQLDALGGGRSTQDYIKNTQRIGFDIDFLEALREYIYGTMIGWSNVNSDTTITANRAFRGDAAMALGGYRHDFAYEIIYDGSHYYLVDRIDVVPGTETLTSAAVTLQLTPLNALGSRSTIQAVRTWSGERRGGQAITMVGRDSNSDLEEIIVTRFIQDITMNGHDTSDALTAFPADYRNYRGVVEQILSTLDLGFLQAEIEGIERDRFDALDNELPDRPYTFNGVNEMVFAPFAYGGEVPIPNIDNADPSFPLLLNVPNGSIIETEVNGVPTSMVMAPMLGVSVYKFVPITVLGFVTELAIFELSDGLRESRYPDCDFKDISDIQLFEDIFDANRNLLNANNGAITRSIFKDNLKLDDYFPRMPTEKVMGKLPDGADILIERPFMPRQQYIAVAFELNGIATQRNDFEHLYFSSGFVRIGHIGNDDIDLISEYEYDFLYNGSNHGFSNGFGRFGKWGSFEEDDITDEELMEELGRHNSNGPMEWFEMEEIEDEETGFFDWTHRDVMIDDVTLENGDPNPNHPFVFGGEWGRPWMWGGGAAPEYMDDSVEYGIEAKVKIKQLDSDFVGELRRSVRYQQDEDGNIQLIVNFIEIEDVVLLRFISPEVGQFATFAIHTIESMISGFDVEPFEMDFDDMGFS